MKLINKIIQRLTTKNYLRNAIQYYPRKVMMLRDLHRLKQYHLGIKQDFTITRNARLIQLVQYAYKYCPYYQNVFRTRDMDMSRIVNRFDEIPLLDKGIIRQNSQGIVSSELSRMRYGTGNTGGSTGEPLIFNTSNNFDAEHQAFLYKQMGYKDGDRILAMDGSSIPDDLINRNIYWKKKAKKDVPYGSMALSSLYLKDATIGYYVDFINTFKPAIIRGYPAFINEIALYLTKNGDEISHALKGIELTSESAYENQIHNIIKAFNTKVYLQYGHSEAALFGYTLDESYEYYCSPFYGYVEVIDAAGRHVSPGELGEVVCTGFYNYAMPFIRYRTGDLAVFREDRNGIVRLKSLRGRTQDYIYDTNMRKTLLTALVFGLHYKAFANIRKWQIIQDKPGEVTIHIVRDKGFHARDEEEIRLNFLNVAQVKTTFKYVESIHLTKRGKSKFLVQQIVQ